MKPTLLECGLIGALLAVVVLTGLTAKYRPTGKAAVAASFSTSIAAKGVTCLADGRAWPARADGMCFMADKPN